MNVSKTTEEKLGEAIVKHYLNGVGFGKMTKNDFEVLIFYLLRNQEFKDASNFTLSTILKVPETKIKRLDYESRLIYGDNGTTDYQLLLYLSKAKYDKHTEKFQFVIENKFDRYFLEAKVKEMQSFIDTSFNSEIVTISKEDLVNLLQQCYSINEDDKQFLFDNIGKQAKPLEDEKGKLNWNKILQKFVEGIAESSGKVLIESIADYLSPARIICQSIIHTINKLK